MCPFPTCNIKCARYCYEISKIDINNTSVFIRSWSSLFLSVLEEYSSALDRTSCEEDTSERVFVLFLFHVFLLYFATEDLKASSGNCPKHRDGVMCEISFCVDDVQVLYSSDLEAQNKKAHFRTNQELWSLPENVFKGSIIIKTQETNHKKEQLCE